MFEKALYERASDACELCGSVDKLDVYEIPPNFNGSVDQAVLTCATCRNQITGLEEVDVNHWRCLNDAMWKPVPAVQVVSWRMLNRIKQENWALDLLDMLYLDDELLAWAELDNQQADDDSISHKDANGAMLSSGDSVVLTKDLNVKGANFTAKRGTVVKNISLVQENSNHIEGKINGQRIVILTQYVKKS